MTSIEIPNFLLDDFSGESPPEDEFERELFYRLARKRSKDRIYAAEKRKRLPNLKRWEGMKARCLNPQHKSYDDYGGRGIKIYDEWITSFEAFNQWLTKNLGACPDGYTLDRINNDGNYEPGNLRWADPKTQAVNQRR